MGYSVGQVARLAGVTVRTLHHYDEVGLLSPRGRTPAGYRQYDDADLERLQQILAYRELGFPLEDITTLLDGDADRMAHLERQHTLLTARIERLEEIRAALELTMEAHKMGINLTPEEMLDVFGDHDPTEHAAEAQQRWGHTDAYAQSNRRTSSYTKEDWQRLGAEVAEIEHGFVAAMNAGAPPDGDTAMDLAETHRQHISRWFYDCSHQMQVGLAEMYVADPRFTAHYDDQAPGLAQYVHDAIVANAARAGR